MSMYKDFVTECTSWTIHEDINYFYTFRITNGVFFIKNLYIKPSHRGTSTFFKMKRDIYERAKELSSEYIAGEFYIENPFYKKWLSIISKMGFILVPKDNDLTKQYAYLCIDDWKCRS